MSLNDRLGWALAGLASARNSSTIECAKWYCDAVVQTASWSGEHRAFSACAPKAPQAIAPAPESAATVRIPNKPRQSLSKLAFFGGPKPAPPTFSRTPARPRPPFPRGAPRPVALGEARSVVGSSSFSSPGVCGSQRGIVSRLIHREVVTPSVPGMGNSPQQHPRRATNTRGQRPIQGRTTNSPVASRPAQSAVPRNLGTAQAPRAQQIRCPTCSRHLVMPDAPQFFCPCGGLLAPLCLVFGPNLEREFASSNATLPPQVNFSNAPW